MTTLSNNIQLFYIRAAGCRPCGCGRCRRAKFQFKIKLRFAPTKKFNREIKKTYRFENFLIRKDYIIEWFLGGSVYNFSKQISKFGITPIVEKYDKNRNKIKNTTNYNIDNNNAETSKDDFFEMFKQDSANVVPDVHFYNNEGFNNIELLRLNQKLQAKEMMNDTRYQ